MHQVNENYAYYQRAAQLMEWRRYQEAAVEAQQWIESDPENATAYAMLAQIYMRAGESGKALHWCSEALRCDPEDEMAWYVRANVLYELGKEQECLAAIAEGLRIDPFESHYYWIRCNMLIKKSKFTQAKDEMDKALEIDPDNSLYLAVDSYLHALGGRFGESRASEAAALRLNPEHDYTLLYLAWAAEKRGEYGKEQDYLTTAVRLDPTDAQIRQEYMSSLQKRYWFYRILLLPAAIRKLKPWQIFALWIFAWMAMKSLLFALIILQILAHWTSKLLVLVKVFGWRSLFRRSV